MKTIVLIHGWGYRNYTKFGYDDAWHNRTNFVSELSMHFNVIKFNLPGFCGESEPNKIWDLKDYAEFFQKFILKLGIIPDVVLGYSFGAAVAIQWKLIYDTPTKLVLVSPAISRAYKKRGFIQYLSFIKKLIPKTVTNLLRDCYLKMIRNLFYTEGTSFLRGSYLNIVKIDLSEQTKELTPDSVLLIFGSKDTMTPPSIFLNRVKGSPIADRVIILKDGDHDIANSHFLEITNHIVKFVG